MPWTPVTLAQGDPKFHLNNATLDSMSFPAIDVIHEFTAKWWKEPSPNVCVVGKNKGSRCRRGVFRVVILL